MKPYASFPLGLLALLWALPLPAFNPPASSTAANDKAQNSKKSNCNTGGATGAGVGGCINLRIPFGRIAHGPDLSPGYIALEHDRASSVLYTPEGLAYRLFVFSTVSSDDGRDVTVVQANGTPVTYRFQAGASVGVPTDRESDFVNRLQRLDAAGAPATNAASAVWYDHWYSDGSRVRLSVSNRVSAAVFTAAGRFVTPENCGISYTLDADGGLRQVWSDADGLADVVVVGSNAVYEIRLYAPGAASAATNAAGLHAVLGSPHTVWRISNPDAASGGRTRLVAVEEKGAFALTNTWSYIQAKDDWALAESGGGRTTLKTTEWNAGRTEKLQRNYVYGPDGKTLAAYRTSRWETFTWGLAETETVTDPDGLALAVSRTYYTDPTSTGRYARVKTVLRPDGGWEAYDYDAAGRVTLKVTPWLGQPSSPEGRTAAQLAATGLSVSYAYASLAEGDTPGLVDDRPRTTETRVAGTLAARAYAAYVRETDGSLTETRETCTDLSAAFGAASNLRTVIAHYPANANARVKSVLSPGGALRSFAYAAGDWSGSLADPGVAAFAEDADGKALRTTVTEGAEASPDGIAGRSLRTVTYEDARGDAVLAETWARSATGFVRVAWTAAACDAFHNVTSRVDSAGYASSASWTGRDKPAAAADDFGLRYAYGYDILGRLSSETRHALGCTGEPACSPSCRTVRYAYDAFDLLSGASVSGGGLTRQLLAASRDRAARPVSVTDENGRTTAYAYADGGRTVTETLPGGGTRVRAFWPGGLARSVTGSAAAPPVWYAYGVADGLLLTRASAGAEDSPSSVARYEDPAGRTVRRTCADGLSESLAYDLAGRLTNALDRAGLAARFAWDPFGNPLSVSRQADAGFATVSFGLDRPSLAESVTNEAGVLVGRTVRDIPGRKITETDIDGLDRITRYAGGGRAVSVLRPDGVLVSNVWDAAGRLSEVRHDGTDALGLAWRSDGLLNAASNAASAVSWSYDALGRVTSETARASNVECRVSYALSSAALPTNTALSVGSWTLGVERSFDSADRLSSLTSPAGTFRIAYDGTNALPSVVTNAALSECSAYDVLGRLTNTVCRGASGETVASFRYRYDASGFVTQKIASVGGSAVTNAYGYDALGRLVSESVTNAVTSFSYDSAGNRLGSAGASPATFDYVNNRLVSVSANGAAASAVLYDAAGNVTSLVSRAGVTLSLSWNTLGQLVSVSTNGAFAESYAYDALGRRISTTSLSTTNHQPSTINHLYDGDRCAADTDASGNLLRAYTWGPGTDNLLAVTVCSSGATNTCYAIRDHLGSVCSLVDASGANQEECRYGAWGETAILNASYQPVAVSGIGNRFMFHGGAYSAATGLYQFRARWYAPELGRWLSPDPIGLEGGLNLYEFCRNDPVNYRDPSGLESVWGAAWEGFTSDLAENGLMNASAGAYGLLRSPWDLLKGMYNSAAGLGSFLGRMGVDPICTLSDTLDALRNFDALSALNDWMNDPEAIGSTIGQIGIGIGSAKALSATRYSQATATDVKVIGRLDDTAVAKGWAGHDVLDIPNWTLKKNMQWIDKGIANKQPFYTASPQAGNMLQTSGPFAGQPTIYAQELQRIQSAGYTQVGDYYVHPEKIGTFKP